MRGKTISVAVIGTRGFPGVQGGIEYHCEQLYPRLSELGCDITVFTRKPYVDQSLHSYKGVALLPVACPRSKFFENIIYSLKATVKARKIKPDILHIHSSFIFAPLAKLLGMKVVLTIHCQSYKHKKWGLPARFFLRLNEALGVMFSDKTITISMTIASTMEKQYRRPVVFIPNGVNMPVLASAENELMKHGITKGKYILYVGRLIAGKGLEELMGAFNTGDFKDWKLVIVGRADHEDKYSRELKERARQNSNIIFTGFLTGAPLQELYSHAGLFVLPSYYEGLPVVLLEAMSYGLSCIASDIPANKNIGLSGNRLFRVGDVDSFVSKIKEFIAKPFTEVERKKQMSFITGKYSWEKIAARTMEIYKAVILKN